MKTKYVMYALFLSLLMACGEQKSKSNSLEELKSKQQTTETVKVAVVSYKDSISNISDKLSDLKNTQLSAKQKLALLNRKKDSVSKLLTEVKKSLEQVNAKKIAPGIEGVNSKLAELKGQRENASEQLVLQEKETVLAEKKIVLLNEEKTVYDAQHSALWSKGAAPEDFKVVDSLLAGINGKIREQTLKVKTLKTTIADVKDQVISIDEQRKSLGNKIRNNYTAKQIFDEYAKEEQGRLMDQLKVIGVNLEINSKESDSINGQIQYYSGNKNSFETKQYNKEELAALNIRESMEANAELEKQKTDLENSKKDKMKNTALVVVGLIALILVLFYFVGKMRKSKKQQS